MPKFATILVHSWATGFGDNLQSTVTGLAGRMLPMAERRGSAWAMALLCAIGIAAPFNGWPQSYPRPLAPSPLTYPTAEPRVGSSAIVPVLRYESWIISDRVLFAADRADLTAAAQQTLREAAYVMLTVPDRRFTIEGHADERGTPAYNVALGMRRATAVRDALVRLGVPSDRLVVVSYGNDRPVVLGHAESAWRQNRRAVIAGILDVPYKPPAR
jgi:peptidoglycan-associated lipoprotein